MNYVFRKTNKMSFQSNIPICLYQVHWRVGWLKQEAEAKRKEQEALERERVAYAQVQHTFLIFNS